MEGRQKTKKALPLKKRKPLRENKGCTTLFPMWFQIAATLSRVTYVNLSMYAWDRWLLSNHSILDPMHKKTSISLLLTRLNCI